MREFVRRNLFIVLGVALPLALIGLILVVQTVHRWGVEPPDTSVLYIYRSDYYLRQHLDIDVEGGTLSMSIRRPDNDRTADRLEGGSVRLAIYNASTEMLTEYDLELPEFEEGDDSPSLTIDLPSELTAMRLSTTPESPEGFRFQTRSRSRGGLFGELFGYGSYGTRFELERDGIGFPVPGEGGYVAGDAWIAWVLEP